MAGTKPDRRQIQLAKDYKSDWIDGVVESCTSTRLEVRTAVGQVIPYALSDRQAPFSRGDDVKLCPNWALARRKDRYVVILQTDEGYGYPPLLSSALPAVARDWAPAERAAWLYGYAQWVENEDWGDVSFEGLGADREFRAWAFDAFTEMHLETRGSDEDSEDG